MDRALYIWGCARGTCRGKDGRYVLAFCNTMFFILMTRSSVRAWRGLRRNEAYAAKLEKRLARNCELKEAKDKAGKQEITLKSNPFSVRWVFCPLDPR
jgi:pre-rRNA-processing protein TSR4